MPNNLVYLKWESRARTYFIIACHAATAFCARPPGPIWTDGSDVYIDAFHLVFHLHFDF